MYTDYWIKTPDAATWISQAQTAGILIPGQDLDGNSILIPAQGISVDVIGTIYTPGEYMFNADGSTTTITDPVPLTGYHVNVRSSVDINISELSTINKPNNPHRVWF